MLSSAVLRCGCGPEPHALVFVWVADGSVGMWALSVAAACRARSVGTGKHEEEAAAASVKQPCNPAVLSGERSHISGFPCSVCSLACCALDDMESGRCLWSELLFLFFCPCMAGLWGSMQKNEFCSWLETATDIGNNKAPPFPPFRPPLLCAHSPTSRFPKRGGFHVATLAKGTGIVGIKWKSLVLYLGMCSLPYICFLLPRFLPAELSYCCSL